MSNVKIEGNASGTGTLTIAAPNANTDRTLTLPDGAGEVLIGSGGASNSVVAFSAYMSSNQSLTGGVFTKLQFDTENFDTDSCYDNSTNYRFTPTVAGYYQINIGCELGASSSPLSLHIYKNGSTVFKVNGMYVSGVINAHPAGSDLIYLNGSTDYVEVYGWTNTTYSTSTASQDKSTFSGYLVRAD